MRASKTIPIQIYFLSRTLLPYNFNNHSFLSLSVKFHIKYLFPGTQV
jgi:hypothetical protein